MVMGTSSGMTGTVSNAVDKYDTKGLWDHSWSASDSAEMVRVQARTMHSPSYYEKDLPEKKTLKMKEELTLCSEKLWN